MRSAKCEVRSAKCESDWIAVTFALSHSALSHCSSGRVPPLRSRPGCARGRARYDCAQPRRAAAATIPPWRRRPGPPGAHPSRSRRGQGTGCGTRSTTLSPHTAVKSTLSRSWERVAALRRRVRAPRRHSEARSRNEFRPATSHGTGEVASPSEPEGARRVAPPATPRCSRTSPARPHRSAKPLFCNILSVVPGREHMLTGQRPRREHLRTPAERERGVRRWPPPTLSPGWAELVLVPTWPSPAASDHPQDRRLPTAFAPLGAGPPRPAPRFFCTDDLNRSPAPRSDPRNAQRAVVLPPPRTGGGLGRGLLAAAPKIRRSTMSSGFDHTEQVSVNASGPPRTHSIGPARTRRTNALPERTRRASCSAS